MTDRSDLDIKALRQDLKMRIAEFQRLIELSQESRAPVELDQTMQGRLSRQDALQQQEMAKETDRRRKAEIARCENALIRMEGTEYGYCIKCDEEIELKRMQNDPAVLTCIACASKL